MFSVTAPGMAYVKTDSYLRHISLSDFCIWGGGRRRGQKQHRERQEGPEGGEGIWVREGGLTLWLWRPARNLASMRSCSTIMMKAPFLRAAALASTVIPRTYTHTTPPPSTILWSKLLTEETTWHHRAPYTDPNQLTDRQANRWTYISSSDE